MTFFQIFFNISFRIVLEAMYIKFGDPKSIIADFQFFKPKKCLKTLFKNAKIEKKKVFRKNKKKVPLDNYERILKRV